MNQPFKECLGDLEARIAPQQCATVERLGWRCCMSKHPLEMLKAEIDVYWIQAAGGDPAAWIRKCAGREPTLHLKDMAVGPDREQRMAEIGEGNMNWPVILQAAEESGVEWYLVEQDYCYERDPFESLAISYRNLRAMGLS